MTVVLRVLPGWGGVALIVGGLSLELAALAGVAWATVGYAIFRAAGRRTERPSRVR